MQRGATDLPVNYFLSPCHIQTYCTALLCLGKTVRIASDGLRFACRKNVQMLFRAILHVVVLTYFQIIAQYIREHHKIGQLINAKSKLLPSTCATLTLIVFQLTKHADNVMSNTCPFSSHPSKVTI